MGKREGMGAEVPQTLVSRVAAGFRYALSGDPSGVWMGPMSPVPPAVPDADREERGVAGRRYDYPVGANVSFRPRATEAISFGQLRALSENFDILRLVIETRKDQVCELPWKIIPVGGAKPGAKPDAGMEAAEALLRCPDGVHSWEEWLRMLLEDLFVLDAPTIYVRPNLGGGVYGFDPVDGATIKPLIDAFGRRPAAPDPAYQQILKGVPAGDYTTDEMIYRPRNPRTHKAYGYGPVEQIINTVNVALRRQLFVQEYFTSGSVPDALAGVPETWTTEQIAKFQGYWDTLLASEDGNTAARRKLRFVPGEIARNFKETKQPPLKDMFDEWLARITCYCFSIDVTPFVAQVNRSVAETNREQSLAEGLGPTQRWAKSVADDILRRAGFAGYELAWQEGKIVDPKKRAEVLKIYVDMKALHPDEVREEELGREPLTDEQKADLTPPPPVMPGEEPPPPGKKPAVAKAYSYSGQVQTLEEGRYLGKALRPAAKAVRALVKRVTSFLEDASVAASRAAAKAFEMNTEEIDKARRPTGGDPSAIATAAAEAALAAIEWETLFDDVEALLTEIATGAGERAAREVRSRLEGEALESMRDKSTNWARRRAAEMVGMRLVDGELVPNPDARYALQDGTRDAVRAAIEEALDEGWSPQRLAKEIEEGAGFSPERALTVARTEAARADSQGQLEGWRATGIVKGKEWTTSEDELVSDECADNAAAGSIGLEEAFPSGDFMPPAHPNCRCACVPVLLD